MEDAPPHQPRRRGLLFALLVTVVAIPLLVLDLESDGDGGSPPVTTRAIATVVVPVDRPESGPPKGLSVVTSSTTSSTTPITTTTTTIATVAVP